MSKYDYCKICREHKVMTKEHIPPRSTFNKSTILQFPNEQITDSMVGNRLPWDFKGFRYKEKQGGNTFLTLCKECNSFMGTHYIPEYNRITNEIVSSLKQENIIINGSREFTILNFKPLNFIKEVVAMFCSLNELTKTEPVISNFLLNKYENKFPSKYKILMNIFAGGLIKANGFSAIFSK